MKVGTGKPIKLDTSMQGVQQTSQNLTSRQKFTTTLEGIARGLAGAASAAAPFIPGGNILSAALGGVDNTLEQSVGNSGGVNAFGGAGAIGTGNLGGGAQSLAAMPGAESLAALPPPGGGGGAVGLPAMPGAGAIGGATGGIAGMPGGGGATAGLNPQSAMNNQFGRSMYFLNMQQKAQATNEEITALSNLMNLKHQTATACINNIH